MNYMSEFEKIAIIIVVLFAWTFISAIIVIGTNEKISFNPIINYHKMTRLNWFGICFITLLINILFLPLSIIYWLSKFIEKIFTFGRK